VFDRFTEVARQVVVLAQQEARSLGHRWIGTEHLLLGLLRVDSPVRRALEDAGLTVERARAAAAVAVGISDEALDGQLPFTSRARRALETSAQEAKRLRSGTIAPEHLLLGALAVSGTAACIVRDAAIDLGRLLETVVPGEHVDAERFRLEDAQPERTIDPSDRAAPRPEATPAGPLDPQLLDRPSRELLEAANQAKVDAIERDDFAAAAELRDAERRLQSVLRDLARLL
jgi:ATP-dependent Clp protease ATP-binding subunit ClpC